VGWQSVRDNGDCYGEDSVTNTKAKQGHRNEETVSDREKTLIDTANAALDDQSVTTETIAAERDRYLDQLQRERADFANFRRRVDQERALARQLASRDILAQLLPVMDDFDRALGSVPPEHADSGWVTGTAMVGKKLAGILERSSVERLESLGQRFDPSIHEAVATEPGSSGEYIIEVYQEGYRLGQSLLRPAMVKTGDVVVEHQENNDRHEDEDSTANSRTEASA
jgi:molecular chaperone GrpE